MEAYGQFAWKLRHYRRGPPESNHSSNGPVCRHLGGRLDGTPYFLSLLTFLPTFTVPSRARCLSSPLSRARFPALVPTRFRFPLRAGERSLSLSHSFAADVQIMPEYHRRIIAGFYRYRAAGPADGRSDLAARIRPIDVNDRRAAVSPHLRIKWRGRIARISRFLSDR